MRRGGSAREEPKLVLEVYCRAVGSEREGPIKIKSEPLLVWGSPHGRETRRARLGKPSQLRGETRRIDRGGVEIAKLVVEGNSKSWKTKRQQL